MDDRYNGRNPYKRSSFGSMEGIVVDMTPQEGTQRRKDSCVTFLTVEDRDGNTVVFVMGPATYIVDFETVSVGRTCTFWYRMDEPMPLVYPPRYRAAVIAGKRYDYRVEVGFFDQRLVNEDRTLQLKIEEGVAMRTENNQYYQGSPANHNLVVCYDSSTRSIPAQTTPKMIVVLCDG